MMECEEEKEEKKRGKMKEGKGRDGARIKCIGFQGWRGLKGRDTVKGREGKS